MDFKPLDKNFNLKILINMRKSMKQQGCMYYYKNFNYKLTKSGFFCEGGDLVLNFHKNFTMNI